MMDDYAKKAAKEKLGRLKDSLTLLFFKPKDGCEYCGPIEELVGEIAALNPRINKETLIFENEGTKAKSLGVDKAPALVMLNSKNIAIRFYGFPGGYEFETLLSDLVDLSQGEPRISPDIMSAVKRIDFPVHIQVFVTPQCPYCSGAVKVAHDFAILNPKIKSDAIEVEEFRRLGDKYGVMSVPKTVINETMHLVGAYPPDILLKKIMELRK